MTRVHLKKSASLQVFVTRPLSQKVNAPTFNHWNFCFYAKSS